LLADDIPAVKGNRGISSGPLQPVEAITKGFWLQINKQNIPKMETPTK
jgi:hypothetical protein